MAISRNKVIFALLPFFLTTIGVIIFVIFFNYADVTFKGLSPFSITIDKQVYKDTNGVVNLTLPATDHTFVIQKEGYFEETIQDALKWKEEKVYELEHTFIPIKITGTAKQPFAYSPRISAADNQAHDFVFSTLPQTTVSLPTGYSRVIWARDGKSACLFDPTTPTTEPKLWQGTNTLLNLPTNTFDCFATPDKLVTVQLNNQNLLLDTKLIKSNVQPDASLTFSNDGKFAALTEKNTESSQSTISMIDIQNHTIESLGTFTLQEQPRFIGDQSLALSMETHIVIYSAPFKDALELPIQVPTKLLEYSKATDTFYYLERRAPRGIPALSEIFSETAPTGFSLFSYKMGKERLLEVLPPEKSFSFLKIDTEGKLLAILSTETSEVITYTLLP